MVNTRFNISAYQGPPPPDEHAVRAISDGPLYPKDQVLEVLARGEAAMILWTRKCRDDLNKLALDHTGAIALVQEAIQHGRYHGSEWCVQNPTGPYAACDVYCLQRMERIPSVQNEMRFDYYIKFALGKTGKLVLLVSCHLSS